MKTLAAQTAPKGRHQLHVLEDPKPIGDRQILLQSASKSIALVEARLFLRECIRKCMQDVFRMPIVTYASVAELERDPGSDPGVVILSMVDSGYESYVQTLTSVIRLFPQSPVVVFAAHSAVEMARLAVHHGARGYVPYTMGFDLALEAVRFVLSGGTYVPVDCLFQDRRPSDPGLGRSASVSAAGLTDRELDIGRAIQLGKSNKVIAYELNICESTVKVHVRRMMKKLRAKNRTEVAFRVQDAQVIREAFEGSLR